MSETSRRIGIVRVSMGLLESMLHLPDLHNVIDVRRRGGAGDFDQFEILVAGPTLPETEIGTITPVVDYVVTVTEDMEQMRPSQTFVGTFQTNASAPSSEDEDAA